MGKEKKRKQNENKKAVKTERNDYHIMLEAIQLTIMITIVPLLTEYVLASVARIMRNTPIISL